MVDTPDLKSVDHRGRASSSLATPTCPNSSVVEQPPCKR